MTRKPKSEKYNQHLLFMRQALNTKELNRRNLITQTIFNIQEKKALIPEEHESLTDSLKYHVLLFL